MSKTDHIQVSIRIKPLIDEGQGKCCLYLDTNLKDTIILDGQGEQRYFTFDHVATDSSTQAEIFEHALAGYNGCVFVYGQTGAGKTHTMVGSAEQTGILPRALEFLYEQVSRDLQQNSTAEYLVKCSYLEIYNEHIIDLVHFVAQYLLQLNPSTGNLTLREDLKRGVYVEHLTEESCTNLSQAINVLHRGKQNRHIASTNMNIESSRSHSVFTVQVELRRQSAQTLVKNHRFARMHFVDLAGSERQKSSQAQGERLREGCNINKSLHILGNVINSLADLANQQQQRFVHYRDSKLTFLLKDSLGGNSRTHLIANVHQVCLQESLSTLQFAKRVKQVRNKAHVNEDDSGNLESLKNEIKRLKQELAKRTVDQDFVWESPRRDAASVMQSQNFLQSLESESLMLGDHRYLKLEELLKCYLEQSTESETLLHLSIEKVEEMITDHRKLLLEGQERELQLRQAVSLLNARETSIALPSLNISPIIYKVLQENFDLKEMGVQLAPCGKQLQQNVTLLNSISELLNESMTERRNLQKQLDDRLHAKYVSPSKYQKLESLFEERESEYTERIDRLEKELAEVKLNRARLQAQNDEAVLETERLRLESEGLSDQVKSEHQRYQELVAAIGSKDEAENVKVQLSQTQGDLREALTHAQQLERENVKQHITMPISRLKIDFAQCIERSQYHAQEQAEVMAELELQVTMLNRELREREVSLQRLSRDFEEGRSEYVSLQRISFELQAKLDVTIEQEVGTLRNKLTFANEQIEGKDLLIKDLNEHIEFLQAEAIGCTTKHKEEIRQLESELERCESQLAQTQTKIQIEAEQFEATCAETQKEQKILKRYLEAKQSEIDQRQSQIEVLHPNHHQFQELHQTLSAQGSQLQQARMQQAHDNEAISELTQSVEDLRNERDQLEQQLTTESSGRQTLFNAQVDLKNQLTELKKVNKLYQSQLKQQQDMVERLHSTWDQEFAGKNEQIRVLETTVKEMKAQISIYEAQIRNSEETATVEVKQLKNTIHSLEKEVVSLQKNLQEETNHYIELQRNHSILNESHLHLQGEHTQLTTVHDRLIEDYAAKQDAYSQLVEECQQLQKDLTEIQAEAEVYENQSEAKIQELVSETNALKEKVAQKENCSVQDQQRLDQKEKEIDQLLNDNEHLHNTIQQLEMEVSTKQSELQTNHELAITYLQQSLKNVTSEAQKAQTAGAHRIEGLVHQIDALKMELNNYDTELQRLQILNVKNEETMHKLNTVNVELEQQLEKQFFEIQRLQEEREKVESSLTEQIEVLQNELSETQERYDTSTTSFENQRAQLKLVLADLQSEIQSNEHDMRLNEQRRNQLESRVSQLETMLEHVRANLDAKEAELKSANQTITEMIDLSEANDHHIQETKTAYMAKLTQQRSLHEEQLKKQVADFEEERKQLKRQVTSHLESLERQNTRLTQDIKEREVCIAELQGKLQRAKTENETKTQQVSALEQELYENEATLQKVHDKAKDFCRQQEREINDIKDQYVRLEEEHNQIIDQNSQLQVENESLVQELQKQITEKEQIQSDIKSVRLLETRLKKELNDSNNRISRLQLENSHYSREVDSLQNEISQIMGHKYKLNQNKQSTQQSCLEVKQENSALKQEKHQLTEQISLLTDEKTKLLQRVKNSNVSPTRQESDYDRVLQDNLRLQNEIGKLNAILNIPSVNKKLNANAQEVEKIHSSVQRLIQELVECKSQLQAKEKELEAKNFKHQSVEKDLLLLRQKYYSRENSATLAQYHSSGEPALRDNRPAQRKLNYQFQ